MMSFTVLFLGGFLMRTRMYVFLLLIVTTMLAMDWGGFLKKQSEESERGIASIKTKSLRGDHD